MSQKILYTIGHSSHKTGEFLSLLTQHAIEAVADVRSVPYSRYNPQYKQKELKESLKTSNIAYVFLGRELGAKREEPECFRNGCLDYELVKKTAAFQEGVRRVLEGVDKMRVAILCAEKEPLSCHRTILISSVIREHVDNVHHILANGAIQTQDEIDEVLLDEYKVKNQDLFQSDEELLRNAYIAKANRMTGLS